MEFLYIYIYVYIYIYIFVSFLIWALPHTHPFCFEPSTKPGENVLFCLASSRQLPDWFWELAGAPVGVSPSIVLSHSSLVPRAPGLYDHRAKSFRRSPLRCCRRSAVYLFHEPYFARTRLSFTGHLVQVVEFSFLFLSPDGPLVLRISKCFLIVILHASVMGTRGAWGSSAAGCSACCLIQ